MKASYKNAVFKSQPFTEARLVKAKRRNDAIQHPVFLAEMGETTVYKTTVPDVFDELASLIDDKLSISSNNLSEDIKVNKLFTTTDFVAKTLNSAELNTSRKGLKRKSSSKC